MRCQKSAQGVTLFEMILVLAISASLMVFAIRIYNQFQFQSNEQKIIARVNQLFQSVSGYYSANCRMALAADSTPQSTGDLDPIKTDASGIPLFLSLSIQKDLVTPGFLTGWQPDNPLVDNASADKGYFVQFNRVLEASKNPVMPVYACVGSTPSPSCDETGKVKLDSASVVTWTAQVAVKLSTSISQAQWKQIARDLNADCISSLSGSEILSCASSPAADGYLVWTRMPSAYNPNISSVYWTSTQYVKQFNMQYTNDGMATLSNIQNETGTWYNPLNYLCGG